MQILKEDGTPFDHPGEMRQLSNGLRNQITHLEEYLLKRGDLTEVQRGQIEGYADMARRMLGAATKALTQHGDI
jgi:hypothetical protein